jgi:3-oxoacyl-[acyl-carrier-protein] synthase III
MRFANVTLVGVAHVDAPHRVTSDELETPLKDTYSRLGIPERILESLTGVRARRFWDDTTKPSDAATFAGKKILERTGVDPSAIGVLVNTSVCRDYVEPSVACFVHHNLGLSPSCISFDIGNACLGFLDGMFIVGNMIERGQVDYGLVVDGESSRYVVSQTVARLARSQCDLAMFREQLATLTTGSGAAAALLARSIKVPEGHAFIGGVSLADTQHNHLCRGTESAGFTDTARLLTHGVNLAARTWVKAQEELGWQTDSIDFFALHQVSELHTQQVAQTLGLSLSKSLLIYPELGNVGPASVPIVLSRAVEADRLNPGDRVILGGIGSGLNCKAAGIVW